MSIRYPIIPVLLTTSLFSNASCRASELIANNDNKMPISRISVKMPKVFVISGDQYEKFPSLFHQMHTIRREVFSDRLKWDVPVKDGLEKDQFDNSKAKYVVYISKKYGVCGAIRILKTTEPNMLRDIFPDYVDDPKMIPAQDNIIEMSRLFFVKPRQENQLSQSSRRGTLKLFVALHEWALQHNIKEIVGVTDIRIERILKKAGWEIRHISPPRGQELNTTVVYSFKISKDNLKIMYDKTGLTYPVGWTLEPALNDNKLRKPANHNNKLNFASSL